MKRITCAFLSMLLITPCMANIHINPDAVTEVVAKHFPKKQVECIREYNTQLKASNGSGIAASKLWNVCAAGGLDVKQPADKEKCRTFVNELTSKGTVKFYAACGKDKSMTGAVCVNDFSALVVNMQQAQGLAKLYARSKSDNTIQCRTKPRMDVQTVHSTNIHAMGMSSTTNTPYVQCTSYNSNKFYEFRFSSTYGNIDATNHKNFKTGICKIFGYKYVSKKPEAPADNHQFDICDGIKDESACNKLDQVISAGNIGYVASWGPLGYKTGRTGYQITGRNFPYCVLSENVAKGNDGYLLVERTAFGLDGRVFLNAGVQRKGSNEIKQQIRTYVENTMGKGNVKSFSCEDTYHTVKLKDRSGKDDMVRCTINDQVVEFFFDDLSEAWGVYDKSGREAMNCIAWGGTFTGKKCIGLDEKMCNKVRDANAQSCPECKLIKWNPNTETCDLPSSVSATNLKKGLNYTAIVGGAVVGVVITVGTLGTASAPTALILTGLAVETLGAGIELVAQVKIDAIADEFLIKSNQCKSASCAQSLIKDNFQHLADSQNDFSDAEISAIDSEMARLAGLIPDNSDFWADIALNSLSMEDNKSGMFDFEHWTPEQTWRTVGITLQLATVITSVGKWVATKTKNVVTKLSKSSGVLKSKTQKAVSIVEHASDQRALTAKQLELQQKILKLNKPTMTLPDFLQSVDNVRQVKTKTSRSAVYEFRNAKTGRKYFLKYNSDAKEIERTKRAYEVLKNSNVTSGVNIVETDGDVIRSFAKLHNIDIPDGRTAFIMENAIEQSDMMTLNDLIWGNFENALPQLGNKALTVKEQELILEDIKRLNNAGIKHGDLPQNMYIYRDSSGKIRVSIIDYESWATDGIGNKDIEDIERYFSNMQKGGVAKSKTDDVITKPLSYYVEGLDKISDNEDLLFNIKIIGDRQGTSIYERRPVIKNILEKNGLKYGSSSDLNAWYIRQSEADGQYELWSPIMKGKDAKEVMPKLIRDLDNADISSNLVVPIKAQDFLGNFHTNSYQALSEEESWRLIALGEEQKHAGVSLSDRFNGYPNIYHSLDEIQEKYPKDKFLFKGATSSDDYMAFSARSGRSGTVYATPDVKYAQIYDGLAEKFSDGMSATGDKYVSNAFAGDIDNGYVRVGFINVYEQSPNNVYYKNFGMESYRGEFERKIASKDADQAETYITPEENPLVEKILHIRVENKADHTVEDFYVPVKDQTNETVKSAIDKVINNRKADPSDTYEGPVYNRLKSQKQALDDNK